MAADVDLGGGVSHGASNNENLQRLIAIGRGGAADRCVLLGRTSRSVVHHEHRDDAASVLDSSLEYPSPPSR